MKCPSEKVMEWLEKAESTSETLLPIPRKVAELAASWGAAECREYMAAFIEPHSKELAASIRANWNPAWGNEPK